jgi:DNA invertase Pin-like site-specific DNA recombinase
LAPEPKKPLACAIYTRKSSEEGLEQEFNSLDAQREACEAYVLSQRHEGWRALDDHYDDGGFSGGNMDRPGLKQLLEDVRNRKVDVVVVYKVDRLTRALSDFAKIVETFDANGVSFVSVTQQFNTTSSMGRLTLNVLLSFAQFEREVTGERIRDKIAASRKKGMWMGGPVPLGYDLHEHKLVVNPAEADTVRLIYRLYTEYRCVRQLKAELDRRKIVTKKKVSLTGRTWGGNAFTRGHLYCLLANRLYLGEAVHKGQAYPGQHEAIIDQDLWNRVQTTLKDNRYERASGLKSIEPSLLAGILFDDRGNRLTPSHTRRHNRRYRYYVCQALLQHKPENAGALKRIPAQEIEDLVQEQVLVLLSTPAKLLDQLTLGDTHSKHAVAAGAAEFSAKWPYLNSTEQAGFIRAAVERVTAGPNSIAITLHGPNLLKAIAGDDHALQNGRYADTANEDNPISITVAARLKRTGREARIVVAGEQKGKSAQLNRSLVRLIARAFDWYEQFKAGQSTQAIADGLNMDRSYVAHVMSLVFLAPDIISAIVDGKQRPGLNVQRLMEKFPVHWALQRQGI